MDKLYKDFVKKTKCIQHKLEWHKFDLLKCKQIKLCFISYQGFKPSFKIFIIFCFVLWAVNVTIKKNSFQSNLVFSYFQTHSYLKL